MSNSNKKINNTALRVFEILKLMINNDYTKEAILDIIVDNEKIEPVHRIETLNKYFHTFKLLGAEIAKSSDKFILEQTPISIKLSDKELETFLFLVEYSKNICTTSEHKNIEKLFANILKFFDKETKERIPLVKEKISKKYRKQLSFRIDKDEANRYEALCREKLKLELTYNNKSLNLVQKFVVEPKETVITRTGCILRAYNPSIAEIQDFHTDNILTCNQLPTMSREIEMTHSITFKVMGRLAKAYELKQGERVTQCGMENGVEYKVITNTLEDKSELLKRLLRYGVSCKIIYPAAFKTLAIKQINKIMSNYK